MLRPERGVALVGVFKTSLVFKGGTLVPAAGELCGREERPSPLGVAVSEKTGFSVDKVHSSLPAAARDLGLDGEGESCSNVLPTEDSLRAASSSASRTLRCLSLSGERSFREALKAGDAPESFSGTLFSASKAVLLMRFKKFFTGEPVL